MQNFLNLDIQTFTAIDWTSKAATRYLSDGSIETVRQEKTVNQQADYNGYYATWLKGKSNAVYYKATLTVNASALTFDRGLGFAIAKGTKKFAFGFGGSSLKQWVPSQADASAYVKNASKILELTTNTNGERSFTVEYIVYNNTLYFFVDGVLTVQIDLATLFAGESGEYQIGLFSRWPSTLFKGGYYAPETYYGEQAVEKIVASGYFAN